MRALEPHGSTSGNVSQGNNINKVGNVALAGHVSKWDARFSACLFVNLDGKDSRKRNLKLTNKDSDRNKAQQGVSIESRR
jgi:hypothetical protein